MRSARQVSRVSRQGVRPIERLFIAVLAVALMLFGFAATALPAHAAVIQNAITEVYVVEDVVAPSATPEVRMKYVIPPEGKAGDTFTLKLDPTYLDSLGGGFNLYAPDGTTVVAVATLDTATNTYTFTLTDYATTHDTITGTGYFEVDLTREGEVAGPHPLVFETPGKTFDDTITVKDSTPDQHNGPRKTGFFTDKNDQGVNKPNGALSWRIQAPAGPYDTVTFKDSPNPGSTLDCESIKVQLVTGYDPDTGYPNKTEPVDSANYEVNCSTTAFTVVVNQHVDAPNLIRVLYTTTITDGTLQIYGNQASVSVDGKYPPREVAADVERSDAGGDGVGKQRVSVGDYVWVDADRDGIQDDGEQGIEGVTLSLTGPDGAAVTDVNGNPVTTMTTDADGAYLFANLPLLPAGKHYTVTIDSNSPALAPYVPTTAGAGTDRAVDSSTGSAESTDLSLNNAKDLTLDFGFVTPAVSVGDFVWVDSDGDGVQDEGEPGIEAVTLTLTGPDGEPVVDVNGDPVDPVQTDAEGKYSFDLLPVLPAGERYTVTIDSESPAVAPYVPTKTEAGTPATDSSTGTAESGDLVDNGDNDPTLDFGFVTPSVSVGDYVWVDANKDGIQDAVEGGIEGVELTLTGPDGQPVTDVFGQSVGPVETDAEGKYSFVNLPALPAGEHYTVTIDSDSPVLAPYVPTKTGAGTAATDSSIGTAESEDLTENGDSDLTLDFGFITPSVSVGDFVWLDSDGNGRQEAGEPGIGEVTLTLTGPDGEPVTDVNGDVVASVKTDADGKYSFDDLPVLPAGQHYTVTIDSNSPALAPYEPTQTGQGDPATDSSAGSATSGDLIEDGASDVTLDFGFVAKPTPVEEKPEIDIEKWSTADGTTAGDYDTTVKKLNTDTPESITFTITNIGNEALTSVAVSDETTAGQELTGLTCDFSTLEGPATGTSWAGPFEPGDSFTCVATLPGLAESQVASDTASVTGVGVTSKDEVTDSDDWNGKVEAGVEGVFETPTPTPSTPASVPPTTPPAVPPTTPPGMPPTLPDTGADARINAVGLAGALLIGGSLVLMTARRRRMD